MEEKTKKEKILNVFNWAIGLILCQFGICLCTKANLGLSMISAPPFIIHVKLREIWSWFSQGTAEYCWQTFLFLLVCVIVRRFRWRNLLSFATAVLCGFILDGWIWLFGGNAPFESYAMRVAMFAFGSIVIALAIAFVFRTTMPMQVYEMAVAEIADRFHFDRSKVKYANDIIMLCLAIALSWILTGGWTGIGWGTVIVTLLNAPLIAVFGKLIDKIERLPKKE